LQRALAGGAERNLLRLSDSLSATDPTDDVALQNIEGISGSREDAAAKSIPLTHYAQENVLRLKSAGSEPADLGASGEQNLERR
jgi:hypothetical protein